MPRELALYMADGARRTLLSGVTTVRCVAEKGGADFALRRAIDAGRVDGPRIFTAGKRAVLHRRSRHTTPMTRSSATVRTGSRRGVRGQVKLGADLIKLMISAGIAGEHEQITTPQLTRGRDGGGDRDRPRVGSKVTAHAGPAAIIAEAVELGLDCVEHGYELTPEVAGSMAERGRRTRPHARRHPRAAPFFDDLGVPPWMQERSLRAGSRHLESFRVALDCGRRDPSGQRHAAVLGLRGHDAQSSANSSTCTPAGWPHHDVIRGRHAAPARWLDASEAESGCCEAGRSADLIAMPADPTADIAPCAESTSS